MIVPCRLVAELGNGSKRYDFELESFSGTIVLTENLFSFNGYYGNYGFSQMYSRCVAPTLEDLRITFENFIKFFYKNNLVAGSPSSVFLPTGAEFTFVDEEVFNSPLYQALL